MLVIVPTINLPRATLQEGMVPPPPRTVLGIEISALCGIKLWVFEGSEFNTDICLASNHSQFDPLFPPNS